MDCLLLQEDVDRLSVWCSKNRLCLNLTKCKVMTFHRSKNPHIFLYHINETLLDRVNKIKDLGVTFDHDLSFRVHIDRIVSKANSMLGFVKRSSYEFSKNLYVSLVRPVLEYCAIVWDPSFNLRIVRIERVQRNFIRFMIRKIGWTSTMPSYESRCELIG